MKSVRLSAGIMRQFFMPSRKFRSYAAPTKRSGGRSRKSSGNCNIIEKRFSPPLDNGRKNIILKSIFHEEEYDDCEAKRRRNNEFYRTGISLSGAGGDAGGDRAGDHRVETAQGDAALFAGKQRGRSGRGQTLPNPAGNPPLAFTAGHGAAADCGGASLLEFPTVAVPGARPRCDGAFRCFQEHAGFGSGAQPFEACEIPAPETDFRFAGR